MAVPDSYKDPFWNDLASQAEAKTGIPSGLLISIIQNGEKSNNSQVSSAGARTPFQIIPATRKAIINRYGIDPYLSPENAAEGAALLLKESLDRNKGSIDAAVAEYHGGTNRENWGPVNKAYVTRVTGGLENTKVANLAKGFSEWLAGNSGITNELAEAQQIRQGIDDRQVAPTQPMSELATTNTIPSGGPNISDISAGFKEWRSQQPEMQQETLDKGFLSGVGELITGNDRQTAETQTLPDIGGMPELNDFSWAGAKAGLGTATAFRPEETVQIIKANYPDAQIRQDAKGNYILKSSIDDKEYAIRPGLTASDIPKILATALAFTPAGRATTMLGGTGAKGLGALAATGGAASAATQGVIEGTQAATGGNFDLGDVVAAGAAGGTLPLVGKGLQAVGNAVANPIANAIGRITGKKTAQVAENAAEKVAPTVAPRAAPAEDTALIPMARKAAGGSEKATKALAEQVAPDPNTIKAAQRLDVEEYLQPDHLSTSQAYRNLSQAVKTMPGSKAREAELASLEQVSKKADDLIAELGGTKDISSLNQNVKTALQKTQQELDDKGEKLYAQLHTGIGPKTKVKADNVVRFVKQQADDLGGPQNLSPLEKNILKKLANQPTYALMDSVRKEIGSAARMAGPFKDADTGLAKKLYSLVTEDQRLVAESKGLGDAFSQAKAAVAMRKGIEDDLAALFGQNIDGSISTKLESSIKSLAKGNDTDLVKLVEHIPADMRKNVVASGINTALGKASAEGRMNFSSYVKWYEGLLANKKSHTAIMTNLPPEGRKRLSDLYRVAKGVSLASKEYVPTGRTGVLQKELIADTAANKILDFAVNKAGVGITAALSTTGPVLPTIFGVAALVGRGLVKKDVMQAADKLIMSPEFLVLVKSADKAQPAKMAAVKRMAKSKAFNDFKKEMGNPEELSDREKFILGILESQQAPVTNR